MTLRYDTLNSVKPTRRCVYRHKLRKTVPTQRCPKRLFTPASIAPEQRSDLAPIPPDGLRDLTQRDGRQNETFGTTRNARTYLSADSTTGVSLFNTTGIIV